jgi:hypothetical protein
MRIAFTASASSRSSPDGPRSVAVSWPPLADLCNDATTARNGCTKLLASATIRATAVTPATATVASTAIVNPRDVSTPVEWAYSSAAAISSAAAETPAAAAA